MRPGGLYDPFRASEAIGLAKAVGTGRVSQADADSSGIDWRQANAAFLSQGEAAPWDESQRLPLDVEYYDDSLAHPRQGAGGLIVTEVKQIGLPEPQPWQVHAFPGPKAAAPPGRAEHDPPHIHIRQKGQPEYRVSTDTWQPLPGSPPLNKGVRRWLDGLTDHTKSYLRDAQRDIFNTGDISGRTNMKGATSAINGPNKKGQNPVSRAGEARTPAIIRGPMRSARGGDNN